jgi:hypothetical protein
MAVFATHDSSIMYEITNMVGSQAGLEGPALILLARLMDEGPARC